MVCLYKGLLFDSEKEWDSDICYNMDESWKHTKWEEWVTKDRGGYDSIYRECLQEADLQKQKVDSELPRAERLKDSWEDDW